MFSEGEGIVYIKTGDVELSLLTSATLISCYFSRETASDNGEEGGDDVKSAWPLRPGPHTCYNGRYNGSPSRKTELIPPKPTSVRIGGCNSPP